MNKVQAFARKLFGVSSNIFLLILAFVLTFFHLSIGIAESIILSDHSDAKNACGPSIWGCILLCCIVHLVLFLLQYGNRRREEYPGRDNVSVWHFASLAGSIWSCVCYFNTSNDCADVFNNNYTSLWKMVHVEVIVFFIGLCMLLLFCMLQCFVMNNSTNVTPTAVLNYPRYDVSSNNEGNNRPFRAEIPNTSNTNAFSNSPQLTENLKEVSIDDHVPQSYNPYISDLFYRLPMPSVPSDSTK
jgi:hypothetical protein